jgi:CheY-like chemotaxis protein
LEPLHYAAEFEPDVVLLDIGLSGIDGYEVARRLRNLNQQRPMKIVAVQGGVRTPTGKDRGKRALTYTLVKPISMANYRAL